MITIIMLINYLPIYLLFVCVFVCMCVHVWAHARARQEYLKSLLAIFKFVIYYY